jgi:anti-anti-sigma regulatory factor
MLRIGVETQDGTSVVRAEGRVVGPWVQELAAACERAIAGGRGVVVDLNGVSFVDRDGLEALRGLATRGVPVVNCSRFVAEQLRG